MLRAALIIGILTSILMIIAPKAGGYIPARLLGVPLRWLFGFMPPLLPFFLISLAMLEFKKIRLHLFVSFLVMTFVAVLSAPLYLNRQVDSRARELMAGDRLEFTPPKQAATLAVRSRAELRCDELCQRLLLNGQVQRVLYATVYDMGVPFDPTASAKSFRMERRSKCPSVDLDTAFGEFIVAADYAGGGRRRPSDVMLQTLARGLCLIEENTTLQEADIVLSRGGVNTSNIPGSSSFLKSGFDKIRAQRLSVHVREGATFVEAYRCTTVFGDRLSPLIFSTLNFGQLDARTILRYDQKKYKEGPPWSVFVTEMLGMNVALPRS